MCVDPRSYEGDFVLGEFHGHGVCVCDPAPPAPVIRPAVPAGVYTTPSAERYVGGWANNRREGQGVLTLADGTAYTGGFKGHKFHGVGKLTGPDGASYDGTFLPGGCAAGCAWL